MVRLGRNLLILCGIDGAVHRGGMIFFDYRDTKKLVLVIISTSLMLTVTRVIFVSMRIYFACTRWDFVIVDLGLSRGLAVSKIWRFG